jgi:hypothetical protein
MDYHKKYLKYKFKYYNLLNQSGGGDNKIILKMIIYFSSILNQQELKILFSLNNIKILEYFDIKTINDLIPKYRYLFTNNIDENIIKIKELINTNYLALLFIPKDKINSDMIELAVQQNGIALLLIPNHINEQQIIAICKIAVNNDGNALQYVPTNINKPALIDICILAVQKNGISLRYVPEDIKTLEICELAVKKDGTALQFLKEFKNKITVDQYLKICKQAVEKDNYAIIYIDTHIISVPDYIKICKEAIQKNSDALKHVDHYIMSYDQYQELERARNFDKKTLRIFRE